MLSVALALAFLFVAAAQPALAPTRAPGPRAANPGDVSRHHGLPQLATLAETLTEQFVPLRATLASPVLAALRLGVVVPVAWRPRRLSSRDRTPPGLPLSRGPPQSRLV